MHRERALRGIVHRSASTSNVLTIEAASLAIKHGRGYRVDTDGLIPCDPERLRSVSTEPLVGIDGYPRGWVAVTRAATTFSWTTAVLADIGTLLPASAIVAIDMPIGLLSEGERDCDVLARTELPGATARVFMTPPRRVLELGLTAPNDEVQRLSVELMGKGVSRQALGLATRVLALDAFLDGARGRTVVEAHPEISFARMGSGRPLASKKTAAGVGQRIGVLRTWLPHVDAVLAEAPADVPVDDALDALACLWTAERWRSGTATTLPPGARRPPFVAV